MNASCAPSFWLFNRRFVDSIKQSRTLGQHCRENVTMFSSHKVVGYCINTYFIHCGYSFRHRHLTIFQILFVPEALLRCAKLKFFRVPSSTLKEHQDRIYSTVPCRVDWRAGGRTWMLWARNIRLPPASLEQVGIIWYVDQFGARLKRRTGGKQCCGSGMIFYGSSYKFSQFRIRILSVLF